VKLTKMVNRAIRTLCAALVGATVLTLPVALLLGPSNETDGFKLFLGKSQDELVALGEREYPEEDRDHNHGCHRLAARMTADRYGVALSLAGGVANEVVESLSLALMGRNPLRQENVNETLGDLGANWRGVKDSVRGALERPATGTL
jgi:hypothetical protein